MRTKFQVKNYYKEIIFPYLLEKAVASPLLSKKRQELLCNACGSVLEIGIGTGLNLNHYPTEIKEISALDVSAYSLHESVVQVTFFQQSIEKTFFDDESFDTVVSTFNFCSLPRLDESLQEIYRILKPEGRLLFLEHGKALDTKSQYLQNICNPFFNVFACGCHLDRNHFAYIENNGFMIENRRIEKLNVIFSSLIGYMYSGMAVKA